MTSWAGRIDASAPASSSVIDRMVDFIISDGRWESQILVDIKQVKFKNRLALLHLGNVQKRSIIGSTDARKQVRRERNGASGTSWSGNFQGCRKLQTRVSRALVYYDYSL